MKPIVTLLIILLISFPMLTLLSGEQLTTAEDITNNNAAYGSGAPAVDSQEQSPLVAIAVMGIIILYIAVIVLLIPRKGK